MMKHLFGGAFFIPFLTGPMSRNYGAAGDATPDKKSEAEKGYSMKREFLQNFKVGDQPLPKEVIDAILDENSHDIGETKKQFADYDTLKEQLAAANKTIEDFKGMDIDGVKRAADEWKAKAEQVEKDAAARIADMEFDSDLKDAVAASRGRNAKAIRALLDVDALKASKNRAQDIKAALDTLNKDNDYLFVSTQSPPPYSPGAGTQAILGSYDPEMAAIRRAAGVKSTIKENENG